MRIPNLQPAQQVCERASYSNLLTGMTTRGHTGTGYPGVFDAYERDLRGPIEQRAMRELRKRRKCSTTDFFFFSRLHRWTPVNRTEGGTRILKKESPYA